MASMKRSIPTVFKFVNITVVVKITNVNKHNVNTSSEKSYLYCKQIVIIL